MISYVMLLQSCSGRFKFVPAPAQKRPRSGSSASRCSFPTCVCPLWPRNQVAVVYYSNEGIADTCAWPAPPHPLPPPQSPFRPPLFPRSLTCSRRRGGIPIHKLTLEKVVVVGLVAHHLQGLVNDVGVHLTNAIGAGIGSPPHILGNHD